ncbi:hypothetical protein [Paraburkholderia tropica]|uniref:hypothetical protein n=1 Tax=Paraburkholderia tropica TaxID=92647 RepID=UPI002AB28535|nr:hypothetical protein [Paraburkholderia tropica]
MYALSTLQSAAPAREPRPYHVFIERGNLLDVDPMVIAPILPVARQSSAGALAAIPVLIFVAAR